MGCIKQAEIDLFLSSNSLQTIIGTFTDRADQTSR